MKYIIMDFKDGDFFTDEFESKEEGERTMGTAD